MKNYLLKIFNYFIKNNEKELIQIQMYLLEGIKYQKNIEYEKAINCMLSAKSIGESIFEKDTDDISFAVIYNNLGLLNQNIGKAQDAIKYLLKSKYVCEIINSKESQSFIINIENNLGVIYESIGEYEKSLNHSLRAKNIIEVIFAEDPNHPDFSITFNTLGIVYQSMGDFKNAIHYLNKAKKMMETIHTNEPKHPDLATIYNNISTLHHSVENYKNAIYYTYKAKEIMEYIYKDNPNHPNLAMIYHNLGLYYKEKEDFKNATKYTLKAKNIKEKIYAKHPNHVSLAITYNNLGTLYLSMEDYENAIRYLLKAKKIQETIYKGNPYQPDLAKIYNNLSLPYEQLSKIKEYHHYSQKAYKIYIENRKINFSYLSQNQKYQQNKSNSIYLENLFNSSSLYIAKLSKEDKITQIKELKQILLSNWLNYKGSISDFENIITILYNQTTDSDIKKDIKNREQLRKQLSALYHSKEEDSTKQQMQIELSSKIAKEIKEIENRLSQSSKELLDEMLLDKLTYQELALLIKDNELYIDYAFVEDIYYIFTLNHTGVVEFIRVEVEIFKQINDLLQKYSKDIQRSTSPDYQITKEDKLPHKAILNELYNLIIKPYKDTIFNDNYNSYIISPDGGLNLLPFDALYDGEKYLIETKNITYAPSGKEFVRLKRNQSNMSDTITVFANPSFDEEIEPKEKRKDEESGKFRSLDTALCKLGDRQFVSLEGTAKELKKIEEIIDNNLISYKEEEATKENFLAIKDTRILHCATHAFYLNCPETENSLLKTGIAFSGANTIDQEGKRVGVATGLELASMKLQGTELVVLSACNSATGDIEHSEGVAGLNKAFIQAGAKVVVASLWKASDRHTADFFKYTYKELDIELNKTDNINYANLIRKAKLKFIKNDKHPVYWSGFVVVG